MRVTSRFLRIGEMACRLIFAQDPQLQGVQRKDLPRENARYAAASPSFPPGTNFANTEGSIWRDISSGVLYDQSTGLYSDATSGLNLYFDVAKGCFASWGSARAAVAPSHPISDVKQTNKSVAKLTEEPAQLDIWNQKSRELRTEDEPASVPVKPAGPIKIELGGIKTRGSNTRAVVLEEQSTPAEREIEPSLQTSSRALDVPIQSVQPSYQPPPHTNGSICLLCKRALPSVEQLLQHCTTSRLHQANEDILRHMEAQYNASSGTRDRAAERRALFGDAEPPSKKRPARANAVESPAKLMKVDSGAAPNRGEDLMRKMGWSGQGLGREEQGSVNPISVTLRPERAGLGSAESAQTSSISATDTYADAVRKRARERFDRLMQNN
jgi:hypothetical protein